MSDIEEYRYRECEVCHEQVPNYAPFVAFPHAQCNGRHTVCEYCVETVEYGDYNV